ncbi:MAG: HEAT repeat domain-containing protein [Fimbriimonadales bacterium]
MEIDDLFARTLEGDYDDDAPWEAVWSLHRMGTREVFEYASSWIKSSRPLKRARGFDIVAQLGRTVDHPSNSFPQQAYDLVSTALQEEREFLPRRSAISALGHLDDPRAVPLIALFSSDPSAEIRFAVACALGVFPNDPLSIETLTAMTEDEDGDVRDWATFGVGVLGDWDSAELRDALFRRMDDSDADAREEAVVGLAKRRDGRVLPTLIELLTKPEVGSRPVEAACLLLGMADEPEDWSAQAYADALRQRFGP